MVNKNGTVIDVFNRDIESNQAYLYSTNSSLSRYLANRRLTDVALEAVDFYGKRILDIGCGDGSYTSELFDRGKPCTICGIDLAKEAIRVARQKVGGRKITFEIQDAAALPFESNSFDIAHIRGALHHSDNPVAVLREALRIAPTLIVIEPNGYNPILKILERFSKYFIEHKEKSYLPKTLDCWVRRMEGKICERRYVRLVPFFCPDELARLLKWIEPHIERIPIVRNLGCATYILTAKRSD